MKTLPELVAYAKVNPGKLTWGSQGFGTSPHLLAEMFKLETGLNIVHVPYRGTAPVLAAILAGEIQMVADASTTSLPHIQAGKLRPLAVPMAQRFSKLPDVPTTPRQAIRSCSPRSGSASSRRPAHRPPSSTSSTPRSATAWRRRRRARGWPISAQKSGPVRRPHSEDARRRTHTVDRRRQGREHQSGLGLRLYRKLERVVDLGRIIELRSSPRTRGPRLAAKPGFPHPRERTEHASV